MSSQRHTHRKKAQRKRPPESRPEATVSSTATSPEPGPLPQGGTDPKPTRAGEPVAGDPVADRLMVIADGDDPDPVLIAARDVIMTHGPRRATLAEVARQAGVSRMTVYRRFDSFDRMVSALLTAELSAELAQIDTICPRDLPVRQQVVFLVDELTRAIAQHPLVRRVLAVDPESMVPLMVQRFGQTQRTAAHVLAPRLAAGMTAHGGDGSIRDGDPEAMAQAIVTAAQSFVFAAQAIADHPKGADVRAEWPGMVDGYLAPGRDREE